MLVHLIDKLWFVKKERKNHFREKVNALLHGRVPSPDVVSRSLQQAQIANEWKDRVVSQEDIGGGGGHSWEVEGQR